MDILKVKVNNQWVGIPAITGEHVHVKYSASQPTQDSDMKDSPDEWIGIYTGPSSSAPTTYTSYKWNKIKGDSATPEEITSAVDDWLDEHPEATTTVQDGSISFVKLATDLDDYLDTTSVSKEDTYHPEEKITSIEVSGNSHAFNTIYLADKKNYAPQISESTETENGMTVSFSGRFIEVSGELTDSYTFMPNPASYNVDIPIGSYKIYMYKDGSFTSSDNPSLTIKGVKEDNTSFTIGSYSMADSDTSKTWDAYISNKCIGLSLEYAPVIGMETSDTVKYWFGIFPSTVTVTDTDVSVSDGSTETIDIDPEDYPDGVDTVQHSSTVVFHPTIKDYVNNHTVEQNVIDNMMIVTSTEEQSEHDISGILNQIKFLNTDWSFGTCMYANTLNEFPDVGTGTVTQTYFTMQKNHHFIKCNGSQSQYSSVEIFYGNGEQYAGKTYTVYFLSKSNITSGDIRLRVYAKNAGGTDLAYTSFISGKNAGVYSESFTFPEGTKIIRALVNFSGATNEMSNNIYYIGMYAAGSTVVNTRAMVTGEDYTYNIFDNSIVNGVSTFTHNSVVEYAANTKQYVDNLSFDINELLTYITPEGFGAVGDGVADDTIAVQECITYGIANRKFVKGFNKYKITSPIVMDGDNWDIELNNVIYTGADTAIKIGGRFNKLTFDEITATSTGAKGISFIASSQSNPDTNRIRIYGNSITSDKECINYTPTSGYYILYTVLTIKRMYSYNGDCICVDDQLKSYAGEISVYDAWFSCEHGWCFNGNFVKMFNCTMESNCYGGVYANTATISNCRARELMDCLMAGNVHYSDRSGILFKMKEGGTTNGHLKIDIDDWVYYGSIDLTDAKVMTNEVSGSSANNAQFGVVTSPIVYGDLNPVYGMYPLGSKMYLHGKDKICVPQLESVVTINSQTIANPADYDMRDKPYGEERYLPFATKFIVDVQDCVIHLSPSYCPEGYSEFIVDMRKYMATIYDRRDNLIFNPAQYTNGVYKFTAMMDWTVDTAHQNNNTGSSGLYRPINSGYCDVWKIENVTIDGDEVVENMNRVADYLGVVGKTTQSQTAENVLHPQKVTFVGNQLAFRNCRISNRKNLHKNEVGTTVSNGITLTKYINGFNVVNGQTSLSYNPELSVAWANNLSIPAGKYRIFVDISQGNSTISGNMVFKYGYQYEGQSSYTYQSISLSQSGYVDVTFSENVVSFNPRIVINRNYIYDGFKVWFGVYSADVKIVDTNTTINSDQTYDYTYTGMIPFETIDTMQHESIVEYITPGNKSNPIVTPEMFGAVGDGIKDDTVAVQACIDHAIQNKCVAIGKSEYHVTSKISIYGNYGYFIFNKITTWDINDYVLDVSGFGNKVYITYLANSTGKGLRLFSLYELDTMYNYIDIRRVDTKFDCITLVADDSEGDAPYLSYNTLNLGNVRSSNGNCIVGGTHQSENVVYNAKIRCPNGWGFYCTSSLRVYSASFEGDVYGGIYKPKGCSFYGCRHIEMTDKIIKRATGSTTVTGGTLIKFVDHDGSTTYDAQERIPYQAIDTSDLLDVTDPHIDDDPDTPWRPSHKRFHTCVDKSIIKCPVGYGHFNSPNGGFLIGDYMEVFAGKKICKPAMNCTWTITDPDYDMRDVIDDTDTTHNLVYATRFIIRATDCVIHLASSYCCQGYNEFIVEQTDSTKLCTIYNSYDDVNPIFDGESLGVGVYRLKCECDFSATMNVLPNDWAYTTTFYTGYNDKWTVERIS